MRLGLRGPEVGLRPDEDATPRTRSEGRGGFLRAGAFAAVDSGCCCWDMPNPDEARVLKGNPRRSGDPEPAGPGAEIVVGELVLLPPVIAALIEGLVGFCCCSALALELRSVCERCPALRVGCVGTTGAVALRLPLDVRRLREGSWTSRWEEAEGGYLPRPPSSLLLLALGAREWPLCLLVGREVSSVRDLGLVAAAEMSDRCERELALLLLPPW